MQGSNKFKILFVAAEVSPFAKTGGLADVAGSLPLALAAEGNDVRIAMPRYRKIKTDMGYVTDFPVKIGPRKETCIIRETGMVSANSGRKESKRVPVYFIDGYQYFDRNNMYCYFDDAERYAFFCRAVMEMLPRINFQPDVIHCNDWHTGPICMLLSEEYKNHPFYESMATVFTIHNLEYQGNFPKEVIYLFNMGENVFTPEKVEFYGMFSFMKAGLVYSQIINTVSETYAKEIQTEQYGEKLEGLLRKRSRDLYGVTNGISYEEFNPSKDPRIYKNYGPDTFPDKKENKYELQKEMDLPVKDVPVIGLVSRLTGQKGLDLIIEVIDEILKNDVQFVLLGTGDDYYESVFKNARDKYPEKIGIFIGFDAVLAQRIYAGSDIFLMPSRFEPCGLGQIISLRYGTIPVVRATGGLAETVIDYESDKENGCGFVFKKYSSAEMLKTLKKALNIYKEKPYVWEGLVRKALTLDYSWKKPSEKYMFLYNRALEKLKKHAAIGAAPGL